MQKPGQVSKVWPKQV